MYAKDRTCDITASREYNKLGRGAGPRPPSGTTTIPPPSHRCPRLTESWASHPPWLLLSRRRLWVQLPTLYCLPNRLSGYGCGIMGFLGWPEVTSPLSSAATTLTRPAQREQWSPNTRWRRAWSLGASSEVTRSRRRRIILHFQPPGRQATPRFIGSLVAQPLFHLTLGMSLIAQA